MVMEFLERDLEDIIIDNKEIIHERGLPKLYSNVVRQLYLPDGSFIDLFSWEIVDNVCNCQILELKRNIINRDAYFQIVDYYVQILRILCASDFSSFNIYLILIGKSCSDELWYSCFLSNNLSIYSYSFDYDGIRFNKDSFTYNEILVDESIKLKKNEYEKYYNVLIKGVLDIKP